MMVIFGYLVQQVFHQKSNMFVYEIYDGDEKVNTFACIENVYEWCYEHRKEGD